METLKNIETYGGRIPKGLLAFCEALNKKHGFQVVYQIGNEPENACDNHKADYWIYSNTVTFNAMECGTIHESTAADCIKQLSYGFTVDKPEGPAGSSPAPSYTRAEAGALDRRASGNPLPCDARILATLAKFNRLPESPAPALYRKIRFQRGTDKTAGLVVTDAQFKTGFSELSRLFSVSESSKMQFFSFSPLFDSWEKAFDFNLDGAGVTTKQVNP